MIGETFYLNETRGGFESWMIATVPGRSFSLEDGGRLALFGPERIDPGLGMRAQLVDFALEGLEEFTTGQRPLIVFQIIELKDRIEVRASCLDLWPMLADWFGRMLEIIGETWPESELAPDDEDEDTAIGNAYLAGATMAEIAIEKSVSETQVRRILDRLGIKRRPPGPRRKPS